MAKQLEYCEWRAVFFTDSNASWLHVSNLHINFPAMNQDDAHVLKRRWSKAFDMPFTLPRKGEKVF